MVVACSDNVHGVKSTCGYYETWRCYAVVFQFFFQATAGIAAGIAVVVLPAIWLYYRFTQGGVRNGIHR